MRLLHVFPTCTLNVFQFISNVLTRLTDIRCWSMPILLWYRAKCAHVFGKIIKKNFEGRHYYMKFSIKLILKIPPNNDNAYSLVPPKVNLTTAKIASVRLNISWHNRKNARWHSLIHLWQYLFIPSIKRILPPMDSSYEPTSRREKRLSSFVRRVVYYTDGYC